MVFLVVFVFYELYNFIFEQKKNLILLSLLNALLLYAHYLAPFIIGVQVLIVLLFIKKVKSHQLLRFALSGLFTAVLFIPGLILLMERLSHFSDHGTWLPVPHLTELYGNILRFFNYTLVSCILLGLLFLAAIFNRANFKVNFNEALRDSKMRFVLYSFAFPYLGMFIVSVVFQPIFLDRYLLYTTPFLFLLLGLVIFQVLKGEKVKSVYAFIFVIPFIASCYYIPQTNREGGVMAAYVKSNYDQNDVVMICPPFYDLTFMYHFDPKMFSEGLIEEEMWRDKNVFGVYNYSDVRINDNSQKLFYINANAEFLYPDNTILTDLDENLTYIENKAFKGGYAVYIYAIK